PDNTDSSTDATSQPDEPTISIEATKPKPSIEDNPVQPNVDQKVIDQKSDKDNQDNPTAIEKNPKSKVTDYEETISKTRQKDPISNIVEKEDDSILI
ncbi:cell-wall-anchored protein, partial [Lactobacillus paracasei]|nr:cell-wall-anchored protein [Lacticaseibacillus paracasei]